MSIKVSSPSRKDGIPRIVPGKTSLSGKLRVSSSKALLIFDCTRTPFSLLEPYWKTSASVKLYLTSYIARKTIVNVPL